MSIYRNEYKGLFLLILLIFASSNAYSNDIQKFLEMIENEAICPDIRDKIIKKACKKDRLQLYYLYVDEFISSFIEIPTSNVLVDSSTIGSSYLAGRAPLYNLNNEKFGTCSASFLCIQNNENIFTDISNYLSVDNGLIVSWFTPTTLINLELDTIVHSMVTECIVTASTKIGFNPFYGKKFNLIVSSYNDKIYFIFTKR